MSIPIVGIGELLWDVFPDGRKVAGGAPFNFAFHCKQLGHDAVIVSRVGTDDLGRELREEVRRLGLSDEFIQTDRRHPTGTVRVTVDEQGQPAYTIAEDVAWDYIGWDAALEGLAKRAAAISFGTLGCRTVSYSAVYQFAEAVKKAGPHTPRVFDVNIRQQFYTRGTIVALLGESNWVKVSEEDNWILVGMQSDLSWTYSDCTALAGLVQLGGRHRIDVLCLTRGAGGCYIWTVEHDELGQGYWKRTDWIDLEEPGVPARVVDTVGAGDAFTAAMVCLHLEGRPLRECARFANHYAARVCEHRGATPRIDRAEVERAAFG